MVEAIERGRRATAHIEAPLPRWAMITSSRAICGAMLAQACAMMILVGEAVEAVASHAFVVKGARQTECVGHERVAAMEGGVEAGDLRGRRKGLHRRFDAGDVVRLVQRRERDEAPELR